MLLIVLLCTLTGVKGNKPVLDLSNSMRLLILPEDTPSYSIIYKLRATDAENHYPLNFRVKDNEENSSDFFSIQDVLCSKGFCEANVVLERIPDTVNVSVYLEIEDSSGEMSRFESEIRLSPRTGPFKNAPRVIYVPESTPVGTLLYSFFILSNPNVYRGIVCSLPFSLDSSTFFHLTPGSHTEILGQSRCDLYLKSKLDFESHSTSFFLSIIVENPWSNSKRDTRNVVTHEFFLRILDVEDTPPIFDVRSSILSSSAQKDSFVFKALAHDGDRTFSRQIEYTLLNESSLSKYFKINSSSGDIYLFKSVPSSIPFAPLSVIAREIPFLNENCSSNLELIVFFHHHQDKSSNPRFLSTNYTSTLEENASEGTSLNLTNNQFEDTEPTSIRIFTLSLLGYEDVFEILPSVLRSSGSFDILVRNNRRLDYELHSKMSFQIFAQEIAGNSSGSKIFAFVTVFLLNSNDNPPVFNHDLYEATVKEHSSPQHFILQVQASDRDTEGNKGLIYSFDEEQKIFSLNSESGVISVQEDLDREILDRYEFRVKVSDGLYTSNTRVIIFIVDINDQIPKFTNSHYIGLFNTSLDALMTHLQIKAFDEDAPNSSNSYINYEIIRGNTERLFSINKETGVISLEKSSESFKKLKSQNFPVKLHIRAYDHGTPSLESEVEVDIFSKNSFVMRFIFSKELAEKINIEAYLSYWMGGDIEILYWEPFLNSQYLFHVNILITNNRIVNLSHFPIDFPPTSKNTISHKTTKHFYQDTNSYELESGTYLYLYWILLFLCVLIVVLLLSLIIWFLCKMRRKCLQMFFGKSFYKNGIINDVHDKSYISQTLSHEKVLQNDIVSKTCISCNSSLPSLDLPSKNTYRNNSCEDTKVFLSRGLRKHSQTINDIEIFRLDDFEEMTKETTETEKYTSKTNVNKEKNESFSFPSISSNPSPKYFKELNSPVNPGYEFKESEEIESFQESRTSQGDEIQFISKRYTNSPILEEAESSLPTKYYNGFEYLIKQKESENYILFPTIETLNQSPEGFYNETKSSLLRKRKANYKFFSEKEKQNSRRRRRKTFSSSPLRSHLRRENEENELFKEKCSLSDDEILNRTHRESLQNPKQVLKQNINENNDDTFNQSPMWLKIAFRRQKEDKTENK